MFLINKEILEIEITNGIRQGCNLSTVILLKRTYFIIEKLNLPNVNFNCEECALAAIFFAGDRMLLVPSEEQAKEIIKLLIKARKECGMKRNKGKKKATCYFLNSDSNAESIKNIEVTQEIKYLGTKIINKRKFLYQQKQKYIQEATKIWKYNIIGHKKLQ